MPVIQKSELAKAVGNAADFATLCVEYQRIEYYVRKHEDFLAAKEDSTFDGHQVIESSDMKVPPSPPSTIVDDRVC